MKRDRYGKCSNNTCRNANRRFRIGTIVKMESTIDGILLKRTDNHGGWSVRAIEAKTDLSEGGPLELPDSFFDGTHNITLESDFIPEDGKLVGSPCGRPHKPSFCEAAGCKPAQWRKIIKKREGSKIGANLLNVYKGELQKVLNSKKMSECPGGCKGTGISSLCEGIIQPLAFPEALLQDLPVRRRLGNQRLIDRFIRESIRCQS